MYTETPLTLSQYFFQHPAAASAKKLGRESSSLPCFQQSFHNFLSTQHDEIDSCSEAICLIGTVLTGGKPVSHGNTVKAPLRPENIGAQFLSLRLL